MLQNIEQSSCLINKWVYDELDIHQTEDKSYFPCQSMIMCHMFQLLLVQFAVASLI